MKKLAIITLLILLPVLTFGQSVFEKYEDFDDVSTVVVTKQMFKLLQKVSSDSNEARDFKEMVSSLNNLTVYSTENDGIALKMQKDVKSFLNNSKLSELIRVKDKDVNVKIYVREGKDNDHISELFMYIKNVKNIDIDGRKPKAVIVSLTGDINLNQISELTDKLNIPGSQHLKKARN